MTEPDDYVVELRVHGVSGTPPEQMLEAPQVRQIAGDEYSRFFVPVDNFGEPTGPRRPPGGPDEDCPPVQLEGYHRGQFTSGSWKQAFWIALIPFGMVNAA